MNQKIVKNAKEIQTMREAGKILSKILAEIKRDIKPDVGVWNLEEKFLSLCKKYDVLPSCKGYDRGGMPPFPTGLCTSINNQSVHCFPKKNTVLKEGDIISIDTVIDYKGLKVDSAFCSPVGKVSKKATDLIQTTEEALYKAISKIRHGVRIGAISETLQKTAEEKGFSVLRDYAGHGIGYYMHEYPEIPCYGSKNEGPRLKENMTICVEALVCEGKDEVENTSVWETKMSDNKLFCIFEHTILVTKKGCEILTA